MWGPFFAPAPDVDGGEAVEEGLVIGLVCPSWHGSIMAVLGGGGGWRQHFKICCGSRPRL